MKNEAGVKVGDEIKVEDRLYTRGTVVKVEDHEVTGWTRVHIDTAFGRRIQVWK